MTLSLRVPIRKSKQTQTTLHSSFIINDILITTVVVGYCNTDVAVTDINFAMSTIEH